MQNRQSNGLAWALRVNYPIAAHRLVAVAPEQSAALRDPAIFMVPYGNPRTLRVAINDLFAGGVCLDFSSPGPGVCPYARSFHRSFVFGISAVVEPQRAPPPLFSSSAVDVYAAVGVPPNASPTLTLGSEYSLVSVVVYLIGGGVPTTLRSSVCRVDGSSTIARMGVVPQASCPYVV